MGLPLAAVEDAEGVAIITNHSQYDYQQIHKKASCVMVARNALGAIGIDDPKVTRL
ncbi:MAG: hypothetical protein MUO54_15805 [Anaerolineales bacterium]|nr:hypothetical protein [Anaerolineales bacterium]